MKSENQHFSNKLFYRTYLTLVVFIVLIGTTLELFIDSNESSQLSDSISDLTKPSLILVQNILNETEKDNWQVTLDKLAKQMNIKLAYFKIEDFFSNQASLAFLKSGNTLTLFGNDNTISSYIQINNTPYLIELEIKYQQQRNNTQWIPIVFYLLIALIIFLLIKPYASQLLKLKSAANQIAKGNFNTRINMPKSSNLYPIADAFDTMTVEIESLLIRQRDLTNAVSHELRTPLARLKFAFEELETHIHKDSLIQYINHMRGDVNELEELIDEMLLYAEATQIKESELSEIEIKKLITELIDSTQTQLFSTNIETNFSANICRDSTLYGNRSSLLRALMNILRNSISFSQAKCVINIKLSTHQIIIEICDDGPGIPTEFITRIFDPFVKIRSKNRKGGYGLGLAIAKKIINNHDGEIKASNQNSGGAVFTVTLPLH